MNSIKRRHLRYAGHSNDLDQGYLPEFEAGEYFTVKAVRPGPTALSGLRRLRIGSEIWGRTVGNQLWRKREGVFLSGATLREARRWAWEQARRFGGRVVFDPPDGPGHLPHFHIQQGQGRARARSGHIFWGAEPKGDFFEYVS